MTIKICALPSCDGAIGDKPFKLGMHPGEYCSRECVNDAFSLKKEGKPFSKGSLETEVKQEVRTKKVPHINAADFGGVGVIRHFCDNDSCANPGSNPVMEIDGKLLTVITLSWKGRFGEYCSNECLKTEKDKQMSNENDSPISTGSTATATKKGPTKKGVAATKKGAAKKAVTPTPTPAAAKKAAAPASGNAIGRSKFADDMVITVKKTDHGKSGNGAAALDAMKTGMTVEKYKAAMLKLGRQGMTGWAMKHATESGLATIK